MAKHFYADEIEFKTIVTFNFQTSGSGFGPDDELQNCNWNLSTNSSRDAYHDEFKRNRAKRDPFWLPRIAEMSWLAISRNDFEDLEHRMKRQYREGQEDWSVLANNEDMIKQFTIPLDMQISKKDLEDAKERFPEKGPYECAEETQKRLGEKYNLDEIVLKPFKDVWAEVYQFLDGLQKPVCIVAHNGFCPGLPVLYSELFRNDLLDNFPSEVYFADSLHAVRHIQLLFEKGESHFISKDDLPSGGTVELTEDLFRFPPSIALLRRYKNTRLWLWPNARGWHRIIKKGFMSCSLPALYKEVIKGELPKFPSDAKIKAFVLMEILLSYGAEMLRFLDRAAFPVFPPDIRQLEAMAQRIQEMKRKYDYVESTQRLLKENIERAERDLKERRKKLRTMRNIEITEEIKDEGRDFHSAQKSSMGDNARAAYDKFVGNVNKSFGVDQLERIILAVSEMGSNVAICFKYFANYDTDVTFAYKSTLHLLINDILPIHPRTLATLHENVKLEQILDWSNKLKTVHNIEDKAKYQKSLEEILQARGLCTQEQIYACMTAVKYVFADSQADQCLFENMTPEEAIRLKTVLQYPKETIVEGVRLAKTLGHNGDVMKTTDCIDVLHTIVEDKGKTLRDEWDEIKMIIDRKERKTALDDWRAQHGIQDSKWNKTPDLGLEQHDLSKQMRQLAALLLDNDLSSTTVNLNNIPITSHLLEFKTMLKQSLENLNKQKRDFKKLPEEIKTTLLNGASSLSDTLSKLVAKPKRASSIGFLLDYFNFSKLCTSYKQDPKSFFKPQQLEQFQTQLSELMELLDCDLYGSICHCGSEQATLLRTTRSGLQFLKDDFAKEEKDPLFEKFKEFEKNGYSFDELEEKLEYCEGMRSDWDDGSNPVDLRGVPADSHTWWSTLERADSDSKFPKL